MFSSRVYVSVYKKMRKEAALALIDQHPPLSIYPINQKMINTMTFLTSLSQKDSGIDAKDFKRDAGASTSSK